MPQIISDLTFIDQIKKPDVYVFERICFTYTFQYKKLFKICKLSILDFLITL